jgi:hypothetical protein
VIRGSAAFESTIAGSHTIAAKCEAWIAGRRVATDLPLRDDASISVDSARFVRRSAKLSFVEDDANAAESLRSILSRPGCELRVWRGAVVAGRAELLPIHWGIVDKVSGQWPSKTLSVECPDLAQRVAYDRFPAPRQSRAGFTVSQQIQALVGESIARIRFEDTTGNSTAVASVAWERDRNAAVDKLAVSIAAESFFHPKGRWVTRPVQTLRGIPVMRVRENRALIAAADETDWASVRNDIIATCERADGVALSGRSTDNDPLSPSWIDGPLGRRTGFYTSSLLTTRVQCTEAAAALRARMSGARVSVDFDTLVHPGLEAGDRVDVTHSGRTSRLVIDSFDLPVFGSAMRCQGRLQIVPEGLD